MAKSKLVSENKKIEKAVVDGYKKMENTVVGNFKKMTDSFVDQFLTKDGETVEEANQRLKEEEAQRRENRKAGK